MAASRWRLDGKRCVVTGGSKGIGYACVDELLGLGATVLMTARGQADLDVAEETLGKKHSPSRILTIAADVSTDAGRGALVAKASECFDGTLDILVNNVGTNKRKPVAEATAAEYNDMVATNQTSAYFLCQAFLPQLKAAAAVSEDASVVNISSLAGLRSSGTGVIYAMTKAAMNHMSEALACEWAAYGIRVNAVCPWMARTPLLEAAVAKDPAQLATVCEATPLGRLGAPEDSGGAVAFLCLPAAAYITGQVLAVDGGTAAQGFKGPCVVRKPPGGEESGGMAKRQKV